MLLVQSRLQAEQSKWVSPGLPMSDVDDRTTDSAGARLPYATPMLRRFGDLTQLTSRAGWSSKTGDGGWFLFTKTR